MKKHRRSPIGARSVRIFLKFPRNSSATTAQVTRTHSPPLLSCRISVPAREDERSSWQLLLTTPYHSTSAAGGALLHQSAGRPKLLSARLHLLISRAFLSEFSAPLTTWRQNKARAAWPCRCARARVAVLPGLPLLFFPIVQPVPVKILAAAANGQRAMMAAKATGGTTLIIILIITIIIIRRRSR